MGFRDLFKSARKDKDKKPPPVPRASEIAPAANASIYDEPLGTSTTIRVLLIAPSRCGDDIFCATLNVDLDDADYPYAEGERWQESVAWMITREPRPRKFIADIDYIWNENTSEQRMHPYQNYFALSYVWGSTDNQATINMNGHEKKVTRNLYMAMRRIRDTTRGVRVWIDALCINQDDPVEKAGQVALMTRIYNQAENVKASIAPTFKDSQGLMTIMKTIVAAGRKSEALEGVGPGEDPVSHSRKAAGSAGMRLFLTKQEHAMEFQGLPDVEDQAWRPWQELFCCPYFRRIWILQEYALAKDTTFMVGALDIKIRALEDCIQLLSRYSISGSNLYVGMVEGNDCTISLTAALGMFSAQRMGKERFDLDFPDMATARKDSLLFKLERGRPFQASQPRDKIFALMGISSDSHFFQDLVTYSPSVTNERICINFAKRFVEQGEGIEILCQARTTPAPAGLPSWVPFWPEPVNDSVPRIVAEDNYDCAFTAAGDSEPVMTVIHNDILQIRGAICDRIVSLSDALDPQVQGSAIPPIYALRFIAAGGIFADGAGSYPEEDAKIDVFIKTFLRGPPWHQPGNEAHAEEYKKLKNAFGLQLEAFKLRDARKGTPEWTRLQTIEGMTSVFARDAIPHAYKRRFCITERGYLGFVPIGARVGDVMSVVMGGAVPFVLRTVERGGHADRFELVGDGYFHGLMFGKGLEFAGVEIKELYIV